MRHRRRTGSTNRVCPSPSTAGALRCFASTCGCCGRFSVLLLRCQPVEECCLTLHGPLPWTTAWHFSAADWMCSCDARMVVQLLTPSVVASANVMHTEYGLCRMIAGQKQEVGWMLQSEGLLKVDDDVVVAEVPHIRHSRPRWSPSSGQNWGKITVESCWLP